MELCTSNLAARSTSAETSTTASDAGSSEGNLHEMVLQTESLLDTHGDNQQDQHAVRQRSDELEILDVNFSGRAQRRLARHARRARIPLVSRALVLEEDSVDVEQVTNEVHPAEPQQLLNMDVSSDEGDALSVPQARVVPQPIRRWPGGAAAPNAGRLVRLPLRGRRQQAQDQTELSSPAAESVADAFCIDTIDAYVQTSSAATRAAAATRADTTWARSTHSSAGFEGQPSSSSSSSSVLPNWEQTGNASTSAEIPPILQVPLSPDPEDGHVEDAERPLPWSLFQQEPAAVVPSVTAPVAEAADSQSFSSLYVEHVRPGMEPRHCRECHEAFRNGQLRLGYTPCGIAAGGRASLPTWVHALDCSRRALFGLRLDGERVSFSPAVSMADRNRLVAELSRTRPRPREQQVCIRPWRYLPSVLQHWPMTLLQAQRENQNAERSQGSRPGWRLPSPPRDSPERHVVAVPEDMISDDDESETESLGAGFESSVRRAQAVLEHLLSGRLGLPIPTPPPPPSHPPPFLQLHAGLGGPFPPVPSFLSHQRDADAQAASAVRAMLAEVPIFEATQKSDEPCVICRDDIKVGDVCRRLPCLHLFHRACIDHWIGIKATCPLCNLKLEDMLSKQRSIENAENASSPSPEQGLSRRGSRSRSPSRMHGQSDVAGRWERSSSEQNGTLERHQHYTAQRAWSSNSSASHDGMPTARPRERQVATRWGVRPSGPGDWPPSQNWTSSVASMSGPRHRLAVVSPHDAQALRGQSFGRHPMAPAQLPPWQLPPWSIPMQGARPFHPPLPSSAMFAMPIHHSMPALPARPAWPGQPGQSRMPPMAARPLARPVFPVVRERSRSPPPTRTF